MSRRGRSWVCGLLLTGMLSLCAISIRVDAVQADVSNAPRLSQPCPPILADEERVSAIYLDLNIALPSGRQPSGRQPSGQQPSRRQPSGRVPKQQWVCADSDLLEVSPSPAPGADIGFDLISLDPSALTLILESRSGEIWEIELATLDDGPLEPAAFASDGTGFFINRVEWSEDGELAVLDADFEVDLPGGDSLWGRVLWNAPWTPDEAPFVPLTDDEWKNAWPGEVFIEGPALDRLFLGGTAFPSDTTEGPSGVLVDSIRYSREAAKDPKAARTGLAEDMALLSESQATDPASTTKSSSPGGATSVAAEHWPLLWLGLSYSTRSTAQIQHVPTPDPGGWPNQRTGEITPDLMPAWIEDGEPWWLDSPDQPTPTEESDPVSVAQRPGTQACSRGDSARRRHSGASEDPSPGCAAEVIPSEGAPGLEGSDPQEASPARGGTDGSAEARNVAVSEDHSRRAAAPSQSAGSGSASEIDPRARQARDRAGAVERGIEAGDSVSLERLIEECWLALRTIAARWLHPMNAGMMETHP